jgi:hypothetical protein
MRVRGIDLVYSRVYVCWGIYLVYSRVYVCWGYIFSVKSCICVLGVYI